MCLVMHILTNQIKSAMKYEVKFMTKSFEEKLRAYIEQCTKNLKGIPKNFEELRIRNNFTHVWLSSADELPENIRDYYRKMGLLEPEIGEVKVFEREDGGYQNYARIKIDGLTHKICDVFNVVSYRRIR